MVRLWASEGKLITPQGLSLDNRCSCSSEGGTARALTDFLRLTFIKENGKRKRREKDEEEKLEDDGKEERRARTRHVGLAQFPEV